MPGLRCDGFNEIYLRSINALSEIKVVADVARRHFGKIPTAIGLGGTRDIVEATLLTTNLIDYLIRW
jgi:hypothetical protein